MRILLLEREMAFLDKQNFKTIILADAVSKSKKNKKAVIFEVTILIHLFVLLFVISKKIFNSF